MRGGRWQKNGNNHRYSGPQDRRTFADPENFFVKKINTCETHNLGIHSSSGIENIEDGRAGGATLSIGLGFRA